MRWIDGAALRAAAPWERLIPALAAFLRGPAAAAPRTLAHVGAAAGDGFMGVMPAWVPGAYAGVKAVTSFAANRAAGRPSVAAVYALMSATDGRPLAVLDGTTLTLLRTAAGSALAADRLARRDARTLLIVGTGALAPELCAAHGAVRGYARRLVWGRDAGRAAALAGALGAEPAEDLAEAARSADVICCATGATAPLIRGDWLRPGVHLDLVGGFSPAMREADDAAVAGARLFVDSREEALQAGDLAGPIAAGAIDAGRIEGDLAALADPDGPRRRTAAERTLYKSAGLAALDLGTAVLAYEAGAGRPLD